MKILIGLVSSCRNGSVAYVVYSLESDPQLRLLATRNPMITFR